MKKKKLPGRDSGFLMKGKLYEKLAVAKTQIAAGDRGRSLRRVMKDLRMRVIAMDRLRCEIQESVRRCTTADKAENRELHQVENVRLMSSPANAKRLRRAIRQLEAGKGKARRLLR